MKKLILAGAAAAAALMGVTPAMADAECQAGSSWGQKPGCGVVDTPAGTPIYNSGAPVTPYGGNPYGYVVPQAVAPLIGSMANRYTLPDGRQYMVDPRTGQLMAQGRVGDLDGDGYRDSRDSDRDGDGVKNYRDRYPDDPRFR